MSRPLDPRLLRHASAARRFVLLTAGVAVLTAVLVLLQAQLLADAVAGAFLGGLGPAELGGPLLLLLGLVAGRAVLAWAGEVAAHRAAADVVRQLRGRLVAHVLRLGPRDRRLPPSGELATLATRGSTGWTATSGATCRRCWSQRWSRPSSPVGSCSPTGSPG
ncbi:hypothetical protein BJF78_23555 [Pseudonocardia sp. CNS-139]|nr:hypothetical protein BJF78_23555 [Pseudonocardia sp. CNS-139]